MKKKCGTIPIAQGIVVPLPKIHLEEVRSWTVAVAEVDKHTWCVLWMGQLSVVLSNVLCDRDRNIHRLIELRMEKSLLQF